MTQLAQRLCLNLTDAFTSYVKFLADFFQSSGTAVYNAETELKDLLLTRGKRGENLFELLTKERERGCL